MGSIHLRQIDKDEVAVTAPVWEIYFVLERAGAEWSPASKVLYVFDTEKDAEAQALKLKSEYPLRFFGIAALCSEAHHVAKPVHIVRASPQLSRVHQ